MMKQWSSQPLFFLYHTTQGIVSSLSLADTSQLGVFHTLILVYVTLTHQSQKLHRISISTYPVSVCATTLNVVVGTLFFQKHLFYQALRQTVQEFKKQQLLNFYQVVLCIIFGTHDSYCFYSTEMINTDMCPTLSLFL